MGARKVKRNHKGNFYAAIFLFLYFPPPSPFPYPIFAPFPRIGGTGPFGEKSTARGGPVVPKRTRTGTEGCVEGAWRVDLVVETHC